MNFMSVYANIYNWTRWISKFFNFLLYINRKMKKKFTVVIFTDLDGSIVVKHKNRPESKHPQYNSKTKN